MKWQGWAIASVLVIGIPAATLGSEYQEDEEEEGHFDAPAYRLMLTSPDDPTLRARTQRDLKYVEEMSEHHRGAVRMSEMYLNDTKGANPFLRQMANAIIFNQRFEIEWLADIQDRLSAGPEVVLGFGDQQLLLVPQGLTGMEHRQRFTPAPVRPMAAAIDSSGPYSAFDIRFAKSMRMHHEMALDMARAYNEDPDGGNRVIKEINLGILADQTLEIAFLDEVIAAYDGDADAIEIPAEMHEMMGMPMDTTDQP